MTSASKANEYYKVDNQEKLSHACDIFRKAGTFGFDTEFIRECSYFPQLCLLQAAVPGFVALIDPFEVKMDEFWELVLDPSLKKIVHAGGQDLEICYLHTKKPPANIVDVQIAAGLAGYSYPLSYTKLVGELLAVKLSASQAYSDWSQRPLSKSQVHYAATDVLYLVDIEKKLRRRLHRQGREHWLSQEMEQLEAEELYLFDPQQAWKRVRGGERLSRRKLAALSTLAVWRDAVAREEDLPPRTFLNDQVLTNVARKGPQTVQEIVEVRGFPKPLARRHGEAIIAAIKKANRLPKAKLPVATALKDDDMNGKMLVDLSTSVGQSLCQIGRLDHRMLASKGDYTELVNAVKSGDPESMHPKLLTGWRREFAGDNLLKILTGKKAVRLVQTGTKPQIEIV